MKCIKNLDMDKIRFGVIGVSNHFIKRIILPLQDTSYCQIYAVASRSEDKVCDLVKDYGIEKYYINYEDLLDDESVDAVYIPLPNHMHYKWIKKALKKKKHVLCEKPMTLTKEESQECFLLAKENDLFLMEGFMYRFHPQWKYVRDIIKTNQIGKVNYIQTSFAYNNPNPANIRNIKEYGGGALMDIGCYALSCASFLLNKAPKSLMALMKYHEEFKTDYLTSAVLDYGETIVNFSVSTLCEPNQSVKIIGSAGVIEIEVPFNAYVDTKNKVLISTSMGAREVLFDICDQYGLMFDAFSKRILGVDADELLCADDTILNMILLEKVAESAQNRGWVNLD